MKQHLPSNLKQLWIFFLIYIGFTLLVVISIVTLTLTTDINKLLLICSATIILNLLVIYYYSKNQFLGTVLCLFHYRKRPALRLYILTVILTIAFIFILDPIQAFLPFPDFGSAMVKELMKFQPYAFFMICLAAPFFEEIIFRGIVLKGLLRNNHAPRAILLSALLFGAIHFNPIQSIMAFAMGLLMGWVYYRTSDLRLTFVIHFTNNVLSFSLTQMNALKEENSLYQLINNPSAYFSITLAALIVFLIILKRLNVLMPLPSSNNGVIPQPATLQ